MADSRIGETVPGQTLVNDSLARSPFHRRFRLKGAGIGKWSEDKILLTAPPGKPGHEAVSKEKRQYVSPKVVEVNLDQLSPEARKVVSELLQRSKNSRSALRAEFRILLSVQGDCLEVSDAFCGLVGYDRLSLVGKPIDSVTSPDLINVPKNLGFVLHFGTMQGLWMLRHRDGTQILVRHESELLPDLTIEMRLEPIEVNAQVTANR